MFTYWRPEYCVTMSSPRFIITLANVDFFYEVTPTQSKFDLDEKNERKKENAKLKHTVVYEYVRMISL